jgi:hypothetical protein
MNKSRPTEAASAYCGKLNEIGAKLEHTPRKSPKLLPLETGVSKFSARRPTQLLKDRPYETTVIHALQPIDPASRVHFCNWFLQSAVEGEIDPQFTWTTFSAPPLICEL